MFSFGSNKYHITVSNYMDKKVGYIKTIDEKTYDYTTTSDAKSAKQFKIEKAGQICKELRNRHKGTSYRVDI